MIRRIAFTTILLVSTLACWGQTVNVQNVAVTGRFNSCSGPNLPTVTLSLVAGTGISIQNGNLTCLDPCGTTTLRVNISNVRWNQSPGAEWLHGLFFPVNAGYTLSGINLPTGFITYNAGCTGMCPAGTPAGPGFYFDGTGNNVCCGTVAPNDNMPCNNFGDVTLNCATPFSFYFDLTFCNTQLTGTSETFTLTGTSDGATGCWSTNSAQQGSISFSVNTTPCQPVISTPFSFAPIQRSCNASNMPNYTVDVSGGCGNSSTLSWWSDSAGGTLLGTGSPFTYDPPGAACPSGDTIYASCCPLGSTNCIGRSPVIIQGACNPLQMGTVHTASYTCNGLGRIDSVGVINAIGNTSFNLMPGNVNNASGTFTNLAAGTYTITATDAGGCTASTTVNINPIPSLQVTNVSLTPSSCTPGNDGAIGITVNGGTGPYQYNIGGPNQANNSFTNLGSGIYTVTATDANGCTTTTSVNIAPPNAPTISNVASTAVSCNGNSNGSLVVTSNGGTAPLSYNLMPGNTTNGSGVFSNLSSGVYTITVSDAVGCTVSTSATISSPALLSWGAINIGNVSCNGAGDGTLQMNTNGGTNPITYVLNPGNISNTNGSYTNLSPGNYTITATDANNCSISTTLVISQPPAMQWGSVQAVDPSCNNSSDGSISSTASGGTNPKTYTIQPGNNSNSSGVFNNLAQGSYTITATDANNCTISTLVVLTAPQLMQITNLTIIDPTCVPGGDGGITVTATGGTPAYLYSVGGPNQSSNSFSNLNAGNYTVTVTDANGCTVTSLVNLVPPNAPVVNNISAVAVSCNGLSDGSLQLSINGGTPPLSYNLMPGNITNGTGVFNNLSAGPYTITVTDVSGCTVSANANVTQPNLLYWSPNNSQVNVSCNGGTNGSISYWVHGGTNPKTFVLTPGNLTNTTGNFNNLPPNTYTLNVSDANNCAISTTLTITQPAVLQWGNVQATNVSCNGGSDGGVSVSTTGGTNPKTYVLTPGNINSTSGNFTGLATGNYTITATDANNCTVSTSVNITAPSALQISNLAVTQPSCQPGSDGIIVVSANGGTTNYQYNIGGANQTSNTFSNVSNGSYVITVTDANNCTASTSTNLAPGNAPIISNVSSSNVTCYNAGNGSIQITPSGGATPFSYNLVPGNVTNGSGSFTNLIAGNYTITVTDANSCSVATTVQITVPNALAWAGSSNQVNAACNNGTSGSISYQANGGTGTKTYLLTPGNTSNTTGNFINLSANTYTVTATDANNCTLTTLIVISQPPALVLGQAQVVNAGCAGGNDGTANVSATGGTLPMNYTLMPGNINSSSGAFTGLSQGTYTITVTDSNNCTATTTVNISQPPALSITNIVVTSPSCTPGNDGTITLFAGGGTPGYLYNIGGPNQSSNVFNNIGVGNYVVTLTDTNGCKAAALVNVTAPNAPVINSITNTSVSCNGGADGSLQVNVTGVSPFNYNLSPGNISNGSGLFTNLSANTYSIIVTDALSCSAVSTVTITQPTIVNWDSVNLVNVTCNNGNNGSIQAAASGGTGTISYLLTPGNITNTSGTFLNLIQGSYTIVATDANNCTNSTTVNITQPPAIQFNTPTSTMVSCNGGSDGALGVTATGGTPTFSYNLMPGNITNGSGSFSNLTQGNYTVTVTDANNCTASTTIQVNQPAVLQITNVAVVQPSCVPGNDGMITITSNGGTTAYQYNIGGANQSSNVFNNVGGGIYTITVTDANNCTATSIVTLSAPNAPSFTNTQSTSVSCFGGADGTIQVSALGSATPISYNLMPGNVNNTSGSFSSLTAGTYTIIATDANGCSVNTVMGINQPSQLIWNGTSKTDVSCNGGNNGSIQTAAVGGTGAISYNLMPGNINNASGNYNNLSQGSYTITATDANNCSLSTTININEPSALSFNAISFTDVSCNGGNDGSISISAAGGVGTYSYNLMPGNITNSNGNYNNLTQATYTITVTDANNCTLSTTQSITQPPVLQITTISTTTPTCVPGNDGSITITASGGTIAYQYNIGGANQSNNVFNGVSSGNYTVTVTDANNCTATSTVNVVPPNTPVVSNVTTTPATCAPGNDGTITIAANNGQAPYQYNIGGPNQGSNIFNNVAAATYTITVTDAVGCTGTSITTIQNHPSPIIDSAITTTASCIPGCDGTVTLFASGGTNPVYSYSINGSAFQSSNVFNNLCANTYVAVLQDGNGCTDTATFIISTANGPSISSVLIDSVDCNGGSDGSITLVSSGGLAPIGYTLMPANISNTTGAFLNLGQGNYSVIVSDANGCSISTAMVVSEPLPVQFDSVSGSGSLCSGASNGSIYVSNIGGTGLFTYTINPNAAFTPPGTFTGLLGNTTYSIVASDANGCSITTSVFISSPTSLVITGATNTPVTCNGINDGTIQVSANGGTQAYSYNLMPGNITNGNGNFNGLSGGTFTITVTDANNCTAVTTVSVFEPPAIQVNNLNVQHITCYGDGDGTIQISAIGGIGALSYNLQPTNQTNANGVYSSLGPANYVVTITDGNNCTLATTVPVIEPGLFVVDSLGIVNVSCAGSDDAEITVFTAGGNGGNSYLLQPSNSVNSTGYWNNLTAQQYFITVTDSNNCVATDSVLITQPPILSVYHTKTNVLCNGTSTGSINVFPSGGTPTYFFTLNPGNVVNTTGNYPNLPTGVYTVSVIDANNCTTIINNIDISEPPLLQISSLTKEDVRCFGDSSGKITVAAIGGAGLLQYSLTPTGGVQTTPGVFESLYAGNYVVTVTDSNNCTDSATVTIEQNPEIVFDSLIITTPLCYGDDNGAIRFTVSGGVGSLLYSVNNGPFTTKREYLNLVAGNYLVSIIDTLNCRKDSNVVLVEPDPLEFESIDLNYVSCEGKDDGVAIVNVKGGVGYYTFYIRPGIAFNRTGAFPELAEGFYSIKVVDTNQCAIDSSFTIQPDPNQLQSQMVKKDLPCTGVGIEGEAEIVVSGGHLPYTYQWFTEPVQTTPKISNLRFGYYLVKVVDASGCEILDTVYINPGDCCTQVFVPNSFSPNMDGLNDRFRVLTTAGIELQQFEIFNRWGQRVWQTNTYYDSWDGSFKGKDAHAGTYYYVYKYKCLTDNKEYLKKGDINIVR